MGFAAMFQAARERYSAKRELEALSTGERAALARDIAVTAADINRFTQARPNAGRQLPKLMRLLSLDPDVVAREHTSVMRDMQRGCCGCAAAGRCSRDLVSGDASETFAAYCPNAETLLAMGARPATRSASAMG